MGMVLTLAVNVRIARGLERERREKMKKEEASKYKIGDRVEVFRSGIKNAPVDWAGATVSLGTVYLLDYDAMEECYFILVKCDKRIHCGITIDGHGYYIFNPKEIRKLKETTHDKTNT